MNKRTIAWTAALSAALALGLAACAGSGSGWTTLIDNGSGMENFDRFREANWQVKDGAIEASTGGKDPAYLVSKKSYKDFEMRVEFWASHDANSGVFMRCQDVKNITDENCYEANIFDQRPDPSFAHRRHRQGRARAERLRARGRQVEHLRDSPPRATAWWW